MLFNKGRRNTKHKFLSMKDNNNKLIMLAEELRGIAKNGLLYASDQHDIERYQRVLEIASEVFSPVVSHPPKWVFESLAKECGHITPKVGVAAAIFNGDKKLFLVQRADNKLWAMPGGWAEIGETPAQCVVREVAEETGLMVRVSDLIGIYDSNAHGFNHLHHIYHLVFLCEVISGELRINKECLAAGYFSMHELPPLSPGRCNPTLHAFQFIQGSRDKPFYDQV